MKFCDLWRKSIWVLAIAVLAGRAGSEPSAPTFKNLVAFNSTDGAISGDVGMVLAQGFDGNLYGTTQGGGKNDDGTVFRLTPSGTLTTIYNFTGGDDGSEPQTGLVLGNDGNFYGTTLEGGAKGGGVLFKITPGGELTPIYPFCNSCEGGAAPTPTPLVLGSDGNFYGTTGPNGGTHNWGTIYKITPGGTLTVLHNFCSTVKSSNCIDQPLTGGGGMVQGSDGNFYGVSTNGGDGLHGAEGYVFKLSSTGAFTIIHSFCSETNCADGGGPFAPMVQGYDGNFYGTTSGGGPNANGTVFKVTPAGVLTNVYAFCSGCPEGTQPHAGLALGTDDNFYGTTTSGGTGDGNGYEYNNGIVFEVTPGGKETVLYNFCQEKNCDDGSDPQAGLLLATNGIFYGTTKGNQASCSPIRPPCYGTIFSLSTGLAPFVQLRTASGLVGDKVTILGIKLTGSSKVEFNGTPAIFTVPESGEIIATVPADATTGYVTVSAPSGTLKSFSIFLVIPQISSFEPTSGPIGTSVTITGVSLTQTSEVTFDGVKASFKVDSDTEVTADVPEGAKTGKIAITTAGGTATSAKSFTVTPPR